MKTVVVKFRLLAYNEGGRQHPIEPKTFGCPIFFANVPALASHGYDVRFLLEGHGRPIAPGDEVSDVSAAFLSAEEVMPHLKPGATFSLWEGKTIGYGEILSVG